MNFYKANDNRPRGRMVTRTATEENLLAELILVHMIERRLSAIDLSVRTSIRYSLVVRTLKGMAAKKIARNIDGMWEAMCDHFGGKLPEPNKSVSPEGVTIYHCPPRAAAGRLTRRQRADD